MIQGDDFGVILEAIVRCLQDEDQPVLKQIERHLLEYFCRQPHLTYPEIAEDLGRRQAYEVKAGYLRNVGARLRQTLSALTGVELDKRTMGERLREWHSRNSLELVGQAETVEYLTRQLHSSPHRVICVSGLPMIGKTDLVQTVISALIQQQRSPEPSNGVLHWVEAETAKTVSTLYHRVQQNRHGAQSSDLDQLAAMALLIDELRRQPLLIILNDADILYEPGQPAGVLREGSGYHDLLRQMVNDPTLQGRLVWVSRVLPQPLEATRITLCKHRVSPLSVEQALTLLERRRLLREETDARHQLMAFCGGNPGLLLVTARKVQDSCGGQVETFMKDPLRYLSQESDLWQQAIAASSEVEQIFLAWLLLCPLSHERMMGLTLPGITDRQRVQALESLRKRGFMLEQDDKYHLHPPYLRYVVAAWLVAVVSVKILERQDFASIRYPLTFPQSAAWRRRWQQQHVLEPLAEVIKKDYWHQAAQQTLFVDLLATLQADQHAFPRQDYSYATGALLTIAATLGLSSMKLTLNGQIIRHADFWGKRLNDLQISHCQLIESALPVYLEGPLAADMSADGQAIAIGDHAGRVSYWVRSGETFQLHKYYRFRNLPNQSVAITALSIDPKDVLVIAVNTDIYRWWIGDDDAPTVQMAVDGPVKRLAQSEDYIAAGLVNGSIWVYDRTALIAGHRSVHAGAISILAFDSEGFELVSVGNGNRAVRWDLMSNPMPGIQGVLPAEDQLLWSARWREGQLLLAGTRAGIPAVKCGEAPWQVLSEATEIGRLVFSRNGHFLVGCDRHGQIYLWDDSLTAIHQIAFLEIFPEKLVVSNDGQQLLTVTTHRDAEAASTSHIQLWEVFTGHLIWEIKTSQVLPTCLQLETIEGLTDPEHQHLCEFWDGLS
jgi:hypothetical protein